MQHHPRALLLSALTLAVALSACSTGGSLAGTAAPPSEAPLVETSAAEAADNDDVMFVMMMIPHHEQAIEMADMALAKDDIDPAVRDLAQRIKDAQGPEIERMEAWLAEWGMGSMGGGMGHGMGGTMSEEDMAALEAASGEEASRLFLEQMTEHHRGAVEMAEREVAEGQHPEVVAFAQQMADAQTAEIAEMQALLGER